MFGTAPLDLRPASRVAFGTAPASPPWYTPPRLAPATAPGVEVLLAAGASVTIRCEQGFTPLHEAVENGWDQVLTLLLRAGSDPDSRVRDCDYTALHVASIRGHDKIVHLLLDSGADTQTLDCGDSPVYELKYRKTARALAEETGHKAVAQVIKDWEASRGMGIPSGAGLPVRVLAGSDKDEM